MWKRGHLYRTLSSTHCSSSLTFKANLEKGGSKRGGAKAVWMNVHAAFLQQRHISCVEQEGGFSPLYTHFYNSFITTSPHQISKRKKSPPTKKGKFPGHTLKMQTSPADMPSICHSCTDQWKCPSEIVSPVLCRTCEPDPRSLLTRETRPPVSHLPLGQTLPLSRSAPERFSECIRSVSHSTRIVTHWNLKQSQLLLKVEEKSSVRDSHTPSDNI